MRLGCCLLCISLLLGLACPLRAHAFAAETAVIALVAAYLAACGYSLAAHDMNASGTSAAMAKMITNFLNTELGGVSISQWAEAWYTTGIMIQGGAAYIPAPAANALAQFANWVKGEYGDTPGETVTVVDSSSYVTLADGSAFYLCTGFDNSEGKFTNPGTPIPLSGFPVVFSSGYSVDIGSLNGEERIIFRDSDGQIIYDLSTLSQYDFYWPMYIGVVGDRVYFMHPFMLINNLFSYFALPGVVGSGRPTFDIGIPSQSGSLTIGVLQGLTLPRELVDGETLKLNLGNPAIDTPDALTDSVIGGIQAGDLTAEAEIVDAVDVPIDPPVEPTAPDIDGLGLPALGAALVSRFPFSIPWDVAKGVQLLAAPPKAPYWEVDFLAPISYRVGGWQGDTTFVVDMSEFEIIGQLSRWTSTIGFCLLLASGTKRLIWTA